MFKIRPSAATFSSPLERGAGGVLRQTYTPLYPLFLEGNHKRLKFLSIKLADALLLSVALHC